MNYPFLSMDMSNKDYHARPEISKSDMNIILRSPAHLQFAKLQKFKQTPATTLGSLFHTLVLQPHLLDQEYAIEPEKKLMKECENKEEWEAYKIERDNFDKNAGGKIIINVDMLATAKAMRDSVFSSNTAMALLKDAIIESSAFWIDDETGIPCRCRPDIAWPQKILIDLKSTDDASFNEFRREIVNWNYDLQANHYLTGYSIATGKQYDTFVFIVCEKKPPYGVAIYAVNDAVIEAGGQLRKKILREYSAWMNADKNGIYKGIYPDEIQSIDMSAYGFDLGSR